MANVLYSIYSIKEGEVDDGKGVEGGSKSNTYCADIAYTKTIV